MTNNMNTTDTLHLEDITTMDSVLDPEDTQHDALWWILIISLWVLHILWQSTWGKWWLTHWASLLRWIWLISEYNLTTRDSPKWTLESGPCDREGRGSGPAKQKPKHNPCRPEGRIWKVPMLIGMTTWPFWREPHAPGHLSVWLGMTWSVEIQRVSQKWPSKMRSGIVHHKSDRKSCVLPTADRNTYNQILTNKYFFITRTHRKIEKSYWPDWVRFPLRSIIRECVRGVPRD